MGRSIMSGPISSEIKETDGGIFIPASAAQIIGGSWAAARVAAGNYRMLKTSADNDGQIAFHIGDALLQKIGAEPFILGADDPAALRMAHDIRGFEVKSIDVIYHINTANLDAHTFDLHQTTYEDNVANAVLSSVGGTLTGTLATALQVNPYVTRITLGTPLVVGQNTALRNLIFEIDWDAAATSVLSYYGIYLNLNYNLL